MIDKALSLLSPHICEGCGLTGETLCSCCDKNILANKYASCLVCLSPVSQAVIRKNGNLCPSCQKTSGFERVYVVGAREDVLSRLVGNFKYLSRRASSVPISKLLAQTLPSELPSHVTYVPTSPAHVRQRGFDHMKLVSNGLSKLTKMQTVDALRRSNNKSQHTADKSERLRQSLESFTVRCSTFPEKVLLIDDIYTTGYTVKAAAKLLKEHGVKEVWLAIVARQEPK